MIIHEEKEVKKEKDNHDK